VIPSVTVTKVINVTSTIIAPEDKLLSSGFKHCEFTKLDPAGQESQESAEPTQVAHSVEQAKHSEFCKKNPSKQDSHSPVSVHASHPSNEEQRRHLEFSKKNASEQDWHPVPMQTLHPIKVLHSKHSESSKKYPSKQDSHNPVSVHSSHPSKDEQGKHLAFFK
jgi:ribosomal protein L11 methylase PrmA